MKSRITSRLSLREGASKLPLRSKITATALIPLTAMAFLSPGLIPSAMAVGPTASEIGLPDDATPEQVLDQLCEQLKKHPEQSFDMAKWSVAYFESQIRNTPAFASALGIIFADCLAQSAVVPDGKGVIAPVAAGPGENPLAERIADTLIALYVALNYLPPGSTTAREMVLSAIAVLDPPLGALVLEWFGRAIGTHISANSFFGPDSAPPYGGREDLIRQIEDLLAEAVTPTPTPGPTASPTTTPLPTPTPPVTPDVNP